VSLQSPAGDVNPAANQFSRVPNTDIWYRTLVLPAATRMQYEIGVAASPEAFERGWDGYDWRPDFLNARRVDLPSDPEGTFHGYPASVLELPHAPAQPWGDARPRIPTGRIDELRVKGPRPSDDRRLWLYIPAGDPPTALLVLFDGWTYRHVIPTPTVLDNLAAERRIPPVAALMVDNPDRGRELGCDSGFTDYVADELVPLAHRAIGTAVPADRTIVGGSSAGGVASVFAAVRRPDVFGNVLSQSGAFWSKGPSDRYEWLTSEVASTLTRPFRAYLDVGVLEGRQFTDAPTQVEANRRMQAALRARGCSVTYAEFAGGHDPLCWRGTLADGLTALLGTSRPPSLGP
jgi:enterochelin esterase family protein